MNLNQLDLNKLAVFSKVVEAGNYRLASEDLNVTPSALSQTIASLEHSLGILLFHRLGRKLVLTESGEQIHRAFQIHAGSLMQALSQIDETRNKASGLIYVGSYLEFAQYQLAPVLATFQKNNPDVQVKLVFDTPSRLHRLLEAKKIDLCFSIYPERDSALIVSESIYREELVLVAPEGMLTERPSFQELISHPVIEYYLNHQPIRRWLMLHFRKKPKNLPIRTYAATAEMVLALVEQGLGLGIVPEYLLRKQNKKSISICRPTSKKLMDSIWMLQLKNRAPSLALQSFSRFVQSEFR